MKNIKQIRNYLWKELNKEDTEIYLDCEDYEIIVYALDEQDNKIIEELEKIKEEMWQTEPNGVSFELKNNISELIDKHISELKGE